MRTIPAAFDTRLDSEPGARTRLIKIERLDGTIKYWSVRSHGLADDAGNTYSGNIVDAFGVMRFRGDAGVSTGSLTVPIGASYVTESELIRRLYQGAKVTTIIKHTDGTSGEVTAFVAWGGAQSHNGDRVTFELRSRMSKGIGIVSAEMTPGCRAKLGSMQWPFRCCVDLTPFTDSGTVATVTNALEITATLSASPVREDTFYQLGTLTWTSGANNGTSTMVRAHTGSTLQLSETFLTPEVGDAFTVTGGCNKTITQCDARYNNALNFQGEDKLPAFKQGVI